MCNQLGDFMLVLVVEMVVLSEFVDFFARNCVFMATVIGPVCPNNDLQRI